MQTASLSVTYELWSINVSHGYNNKKLWKMYSGTIEVVSFVLMFGLKMTIGVKFEIHVKKWDIKDLTPVRGQDGKISDTHGKDFWSPTRLRRVGDQYKSFPWVSEIFPSCHLTGVWFFFSLIFYWKYSIFLHETPHTWNMTWHIFWPHWRMTSKVRIKDI